MIRDTRSLSAPELGAFHRAVDLRTPSMRLQVSEGRNVTSDFALVEKAAPFIARLAPRPRGELSLVLRGRGRFEEGCHRRFLEVGDAAVSQVVRGGTEAHSGEASRVLIVEWEAAAGGPSPEAFTVERFGSRDVARLDEAASALRAEHSAAAVREIFDVLRSFGFAFESSAVRDLEGPEEPRDRAVREAWNGRLSSLDAHPAIEDVAAAVGSSVRQVNRVMGIVARRFALPWSHWRGALHHQRLVNALRLISAPGATTELVARITGFRSPSALCHSLAKGGLPSPGALAREARRDVLDAWTAFAASGVPARAA